MIVCLKDPLKSHKISPIDFKFNQCLFIIFEIICIMYGRTHFLKMMQIHFMSVSPETKNLERKNLFRCNMKVELLLNYFYCFKSNGNHKAIFSFNLK